MTKMQINAFQGEMFSSQFNANLYVRAHITFAVSVPENQHCLEILGVMCKAAEMLNS